jgi:hypothetical protein
MGVSSLGCSSRYKLGLGQFGLCQDVAEFERRLASHCSMYCKMIEVRLAAVEEWVGMM